MKNTSTIIPVYQPDCQVNSWKKLLKEAVSTPASLLEAVGLAEHPIRLQLAELSEFKTRVPQPYIDKMTKGNPDDPLLRQVLSHQNETITFSGYSKNPLKEEHNAIPGLLHKYKGRVLLILASACAVNCRYCFRRHFPYQDSLASGAQLENALSYIAKSPSISEVILSGGDPLMVSDSRLFEVIAKLEDIPHLKRLRFHTRLPVVIPQRITQALVDRLNHSRLKISLVLHINHANEIDSLLSEYLALFASSKITLLNQSVLLKGVNDSLDSLQELSEKLFENKVLPYYLHLLDKVIGAAHFEVNTNVAVKLIEELQKRLPGYLVPKLAREEPGRASKTVIA
ncbi:EF-P beta-lysylation protein EpmB [Aliikangiella sp. G2MR2-5]|uniref:EF-P beta-lysylation protein EpmB n=1 Tax=Aliikangiella sp. G2MR2-5 TaxID=2788943 RepID=UPI0018AA2E98|nr:EF-P beta-lysylation protein EpmB [Aliikangiella sp. G2MR2-5]